MPWRGIELFVGGAAENLLKTVRNQGSLALSCSKAGVIISFSSDLSKTVFGCGSALIIGDTGSIFGSHFFNEMGAGWSISEGAKTG